MNIFSELFHSVINAYHHIIDVIRHFLNQMSDVQIHIGWVIGVSFLFIGLYYLRQYPGFKTLNIIAHFLPTLIHELGHAMMATLTRSRVVNIHIIMTGWGQKHTGSQGFAQTVPRNTLSHILILLAGYLSPPLFLWLGFYFISHHQAYIYIAILILLGIYYLIHSDQKWIPLLIIMVMIASGTQFYVNNHWLHLLHDYGVSIFLGLLLGEIIQSIIVTTQLTFRGYGQEWDGSALKSITWIPLFIWWGLWVSVSLYTVITLFF